MTMSIYIMCMRTGERERETDRQTERLPSLLLHVGPTDVHNVKSLYVHRVQS